MAKSDLPQVGQVELDEIGKYDQRVGDKWRSNVTGEVVEVVDVDDSNGDVTIEGGEGRKDTIPAVELETAYLHLGPNHGEPGIARV